MGKLVDGKWVKGSIISSDTKGAYDRAPRTFHGQISTQGPFTPDSGRYHLYVSYACPWAHRTLIYRHLKSLQDHITVNVVHPDMLDMGWTFAEDFAGSTGDQLYSNEYLYQVYQQAQANVSTSATVPVLWDKLTQTIVNNESSEIIRLFNSAFNDLTGNTDDFYPESLREEIDRWNDLIYPTLNNGVYRCGFARTQEAYDDAIEPLFATLDQLDDHLRDKNYLAGEQLTEADLRLVPTLLRFDPVYQVHFKCSRKRIVDYKHLHSYLQRLYAMPAVSETTHYDHIRRHYFFSHETLNPTRIVAQTSPSVGKG